MNYPIEDSASQFFKAVNLITPNNKWVISNYDLLHYHIARFRSLLEKAEENSTQMLYYTVSSSTRLWKEEGYQSLLGDKVRVLLPERGKHSFWWEESFAVWKALEQDRPDVVGIVGYAEPYSLASLVWCKYRRKKAICLHVTTEWDRPRYWWKEQIKRLIVKQFDAGICGGNPQAAYLNKLGIPYERIFFKLNTVDNQYYASRAEEVRKEAGEWMRRLGLPEKFFLTASRFAPNKNIEGIIRAYALYRYQTDREPWDLVIAGKGSTERIIRQLIADYGLSNHVHLVGYQNTEQMAVLYGLAGAFILASRNLEPWGLVVNEAMAAGLPVLVSNKCGCTQNLVLEGKTGFSFDPDDYVVLANRMVLLSSTKVDLTKMGRNAQNHIANYSTEDFAVQFVETAKMVTNLSKRDLNNASN